MSDISTEFSEHRRKRVRKGTHSCWECKRRKIRCDFPASSSVCAGCLERGTNCISQEYVDDHSQSYGNQLGQRLGRVEVLLEKLMEKVDAQGTLQDQSILLESKECLGTDILTPSSSTPNQYENAPILSLFDNSVLERRSGDQRPGGNGATYALTTTSSPHTSSPMTQSNSKLENLRLKLLALLPTQHDIDLLGEESDSWWLIRRHVLPDLIRFPDHALSKPFDVKIVSQSHPIIIARLLLCVALSMQQLPPDFQTSRLNLSGPLQEHMNRYVITVASLLSDDELIGTMEGLECLILQGAYQINAGNLRRSWLSFRRGISIAQLMGLHRASPTTKLDDNDSRKHYLWFQLVKGDRYLSLILGVPQGGGSMFPFDNTASWLSTEDIYTKNLCVIAGLILERNQAEITHAFSATQEIDEKLDQLARQMPPSWWELPKASFKGKTEQAAEHFDKVLAHIWHFELESLVHLPFMLRATTDRRYEYSRITCLSASRGLIKRWLYLQNCGLTVTCRMIEFQAFTACVTLLLAILQPSRSIKDPEQLRQEEADSNLVNESVCALERLTSLYSGDIVIAQSIEALRTLQSLNLHDCSGKSNLRLTIPHFGTISVTKGIGVSDVDGSAKAGGRASEPVSFQDSNCNLPSVQPWQQQEVMPPPAPYPTPPVLSFTSSQFPPLTADNSGDWMFQDANVMMFDSLFETDIEGHWNV